MSELMNQLLVGYVWILRKDSRFNIEAYPNLPFLWDGGRVGVHFALACGHPRMLLTQS